MGATTLLTFAEFEKLPDSPGKRELILEMPPPKRRHSKIQKRIQARLEPYALDRRLGEVYTEVGFKLGDRHWVQPDVSLVSLEQDQASDPDGGN